LLGKITPFTQKLSVGWEFLVAGQFRQNCWALCWATIGILVGILGKKEKISLKYFSIDLRKILYKSGIVSGFFW